MKPNDQIMQTAGFAMGTISLHDPLEQRAEQCVHRQPATRQDKQNELDFRTNGPAHDLNRSASHAGSIANRESKQKGQI